MKLKSIWLRWNKNTFQHYNITLPARYWSCPERWAASGCGQRRRSRCWPRQPGCPWGPRRCTDTWERSGWRAARTGSTTTWRTRVQKIWSSIWMTMEHSNTCVHVRKSSSNVCLHWRWTRVLTRCCRYDLRVVRIESRNAHKRARFRKYTTQKMPPSSPSLLPPSLCIADIKCYISLTCDL